MLGLLAAAQAFIQRLPRDAQEPSGHALIAVGAAQRLGDQRLDQRFLGLFERGESLGKPTP